VKPPAAIARRVTAGLAHPGLAVASLPTWAVLLVSIGDVGVRRDHLTTASSTAGGG